MNSWFIQRNKESREGDREVSTEVSVRVCVRVRICVCVCMCLSLHLHVCLCVFICFPALSAERDWKQCYSTEFTWHPPLVSKFSSPVKETRFLGWGRCSTGSPGHLVVQESKEVLQRDEALKGQKNQMEGFPKANLGQFGQDKNDINVLKLIE